MTSTPTIVLVDNRDSFVYNLLDACATVTAERGARLSVVRNSVSPGEVLALEPSLVVLSPGPGHPSTSGRLPEIVDACFERGVPLLGICLGFQAILEHFGGQVGRCGAVHGVTDDIALTLSGEGSPLFRGLAGGSGAAPTLPVARYHSLGCRRAPRHVEALAWGTSEQGPVLMAGQTRSRAAGGPGPSVGFQFHPESILSPVGPSLLERTIDALLNEAPTPGAGRAATND